MTVPHFVFQQLAEPEAKEEEEEHSIRMPDPPVRAERPRKNIVGPTCCIKKIRVAFGVMQPQEVAEEDEDSIRMPDPPVMRVLMEEERPVDVEQEQVPQAVTLAEAVAAPAEEEAATATVTLDSVPQAVDGDEASANDVLSNIIQSLFNPNEPNQSNVSIVPRMVGGKRKLCLRLPASTASALLAQTGSPLATSFTAEGGVPKKIKIVIPPAGIASAASGAAAAAAASPSAGVSVSSDQKVVRFFLPYPYPAALLNFFLPMTSGDPRVDALDQGGVGGGVDDGRQKLQALPGVALQRLAEVRRPFRRRRVGYPVLKRCFFVFFWAFSGTTSSPSVTSTVTGGGSAVKKPLGSTENPIQVRPHQVVPNLCSVHRECLPLPVLGWETVEVTP